MEKEKTGDKRKETEEELINKEDFFYRNKNALVFNSRSNSYLCI